ncbi:MAG: T9SS type A sorting domain-containing protein [Bacteroidota bacterium]|nr:T9SS type A sorting domain-containing protein [Bacteroidota bacterium]
MIKKAFIITSLLLLTSPAWSNVPPPTRAIIQEIHWDSQGNWTIEIFFYHLSDWEDTLFLTTSSDTALFVINPQFVEEYFILTKYNLNKPLNISKSGDAICLFVPEEGFPQYWDQVSDTLDYGNYPGSTVSAPHGNQSIVDLGSVFQMISIFNYKEIEFKVKDSSPSIGFHCNPARGTFKGRILDKYYKPVPYLQIEYDRGHGLQQIWTDASGCFEDSTMYAKDYNFRIGNPFSLILDTTISVEPDSITYCEFILPIKARNKVEGYCTNNSSDLAGTKIIFTPNHDFKAPDTLYTDADGYFSGMISAGYYYKRYSKPGFQPYYTPTTGSVFNYKNYGTQYLSGGNRIEIPRGPVSGIWNCDTALYWVFENIWIEENDTLIIDPGTWIEFMGAFSFDIYGTLLARGTEEEMILITDGHDGPIDWNKLAFHEESSSGSMIDFTCIEKNDSGVYIQNASPIISNSILENNVNARIALTGLSEPLFSGNYIYNRVNCYDHSSPEFLRNIFYEYAAGISLLDSASAQISHNDFLKTKTAISSGSWYWRGHYNIIDIYNNIFNGVSFCFSVAGWTECLVSAEHNLFFDSDLYDFPNFIPGMGVIKRLNFNQDSCDKYFNIFFDPLFVNPNISDYYLLPESPCIDAGALSFPNDPDGTIADIGALYYDQLGLYLPEDHAEESQFKISNYPNPVNGNTTFKINTSRGHIWNNGSIKIFDLSGKVVDVLYFNNNHSDIILVTWNAERLNTNNRSGVYCYVCEIDGKLIASNKMILINE